MLFKRYYEQIRCHKKWIRIIQNVACIIKNRIILRMCNKDLFRLNRLSLSINEYELNRLNIKYL